ncbi:E3 ubiquitin-protein ligase TRIM39 isoform X2 [Alligator mississippiensis]|uniref:E3 ubiquitin-protein ligase TRIM39 n=1 Tax=Alligator sinensis TaxID=38654 RepID=A0A3Q0HQ72_ALLSI|nr:E3 ubiquitin-protein ligase TRIM39 isoform X2 [Alligator mississippiensis]XP_025072800.1 E3 ubiquitin-protein ligase TRIM39 isoform X2 [Alligator sinensis]
MATTNPLENLQVEASCSVCLEYLKDPVIIDCGHNFCRACITRWWEELNRDFPCPVCRKTFRHRTLKPNRQLGNMVEIAKQLQATKRKEKLQQCLEPLERKLQDIANCKSREEKKPGELKRRVENRRQLIISEFEELHQFLEEEQQVLLRHLEEEEKEILQKLKDNVAQLSDQRLSLNRLITEIEEKCLQSGIEMLKDIKSTLERCELVQTMELASVPIELEKNFCSFPRQYFALRKIIKRLIGDVTLDPETAHPNLVLSEDRKSVKFVDTRLRDLPDTPRRFTIYPCVLAAEGFTSGRHYWEVEVGDKTHWALGVCKDSVSRKGELTPLPETGYWRVRLWNGDKYAATTTPFTPLYLRVKPKRIGVFLDYEAGKVSFYNVTDRSHIYTFTDTFTEKIWPLFYPGIRAGRKNAAPLIIRSPTDWE